MRLTKRQKEKIKRAFVVVLALLLSAGLILTTLVWYL
jgi:hypothetical protein